VLIEKALHQKSKPCGQECKSNGVFDWHSEQL
jgi:hypothetical protein